MKRLSRIIPIVAILAIVVGVSIWRITAPGEPDRVDSSKDSDSDTQASSTQHPVISDQSSASSTQHPESSIQYPASSIEHPGFPHIADLSLDPSFVAQLETIISPDVTTYFERHAAVHELGDDLSENQIRALYRYLLSAPPDDEIEQKQHRGLKNDVINRLRTQKEAPDGLTDILLALFDDPDRDETIRDYALQQMRAWHEDAPPEERPLILETVARGTEETRGSIAGTALLALRQFESSGADSPEAYPDVTEQALAMLHSETAGELSRITAMQVAAGDAPAEVFDTAARWALDSGVAYPRRLSAIAALGQAGSEEAVAVLAQIEALGDPHFQPALDAAYRKLRITGIEKEMTTSR